MVLWIQESEGFNISLTVFRIKVFYYVFESSYNLPESTESSHGAAEIKEPKVMTFE